MPKSMERRRRRYRLCTFSEVVLNKINFVYFVCVCLELTFHMYHRRHGAIMDQHFDRSPPPSPSSHPFILFRVPFTFHISLLILLLLLLVLGAILQTFLLIFDCTNPTIFAVLFSLSLSVSK